MLPAGRCGIAYPCRIHLDHLTPDSTTFHSARMSASPHQLAELVTALHNAGLAIHFAHHAKPPSSINGYRFPQHGAVCQAEPHRNNRLWAERYDRNNTQRQAFNNLGNALRYTLA